MEKIGMTDVHHYEILIERRVYSIKTGPVPSGWCWECQPYKDPKRRFPSREAAIEDARREIMEQREM